MPSGWLFVPRVARGRFRLAGAKLFRRRRTARADPGHRAPRPDGRLLRVGLRDLPTRRPGPPSPQGRRAEGANERSPPDPSTASARPARDRNAPHLCRPFRGVQVRRAISVHDAGLPARRIAGGVWREGDLHRARAKFPHRAVAESPYFSARRIAEESDPQRQAEPDRAPPAQKGRPRPAGPPADPTPRELRPPFRLPPP